MAVGVGDRSEKRRGIQSWRYKFENGVVIAWKSRGAPVYGESIESSILIQYLPFVRGLVPVDHVLGPKFGYLVHFEYTF